MPPKAKFTKQEIVSAAYRIVRTEGLSALTARTLGAALESSPRPIFTVFQSMEEVQSEVIRAAKEEYAGYIRRGLSAPQAFKGVGTQYILFACNEPKLFQLLFMSEHRTVPDLAAVLPVIDDNYNQILSSIEESYGIGGEAANKLYRHLWIYSHGIATLLATGMCRFTGEQIGEMLTEIFVSLFKNGENNHA